MTLDYNGLRIAGVSNVDLKIAYALPSDEFILQGVDGLGPSDIDVSIGNAPNQGGIFQSALPSNKVLVFRIGLNPAWSAGHTGTTLRDILYGLLAQDDGKVTVYLAKYSSSGTYLSSAAQIDGYISKFEINPFSKDPQVQLTIECTSPYWRDPSLLTPTPGGTLPTITLTNPGNAPIGFYMRWHPTVELANWQLTKGTKKMKFTYNNGPIPANSTMIFDSQPGQRMASIRPGGAGQTFSALGDMSTDSEWLMLQPGLNTFTSSSSSIVIEAVQMTARWWGV